MLGKQKFTEQKIYTYMPRYKTIHVYNRNKNSYCGSALQNLYKKCRYPEFKNKDCPIINF